MEPPNNRSFPQFPYVISGRRAWGDPIHGIRIAGECSTLPSHPGGPGPNRLVNLPVHGNMREPRLDVLCQRAVNQGVRGPPGTNINPMIMNGTRVECPPELVGVTKLRRSDDSDFEEDDVISPGGRLTGSMTCCSPSASVAGVVPSASEDNPRVIPCTRDGYTRVAST